MSDLPTSNPPRSEIEQAYRSLVQMLIKVRRKIRPMLKQLRLFADPTCPPKIPRSTTSKRCQEKRSLLKHLFDALKNLNHTGHTIKHSWCWHSRGKHPWSQNRWKISTSLGTCQSLKLHAEIEMKNTFFALIQLLLNHSLVARTASSKVCSCWVLAPPSWSNIGIWFNSCPSAGGLLYWCLKKWKFCLFCTERCTHRSSFQSFRFVFPQFLYSQNFTQNFSIDHLWATHCCFSGWFECD